MIKKVRQHINQNEALLFESSSPGKRGYQLPEWVRISIGTLKENQRCLQAFKAALAKPEPAAI